MTLFKLEVSYDDATKSYGVAGSVPDKVTAYGMIGCLQDAIREQFAPHEEVKQGTPPPRLIRPVGNGFG